MKSPGGVRLVERSGDMMTDYNQPISLIRVHRRPTVPETCTYCGKTMYDFILLTVGDVNKSGRSSP